MVSKRRVEIDEVDGAMADSDGQESSNVYQTLRKAGRSFKTDNSTMQDEQ